MARKQVTNEDKKKINELYAISHNYSQVARETGFSPSTVKKYIIPNYVSENSIKKKIFKFEDIPDLSFENFKNLEDWGELCSLSNEEKDEIKEFWNEILI